jgi:hypothetical protein
MSEEVPLFRASFKFRLFRVCCGGAFTTKDAKSTKIEGRGLTAKNAKVIKIFCALCVLCG